MVLVVEIKVEMTTFILKILNSKTLPMAVSTYLARHDLFIDLDRLISEKGRVTGSHLIDKNSKCPPVHSLVVALDGTRKLPLIHNDWFGHTR